MYELTAKLMFQTSYILVKANRTRLKQHTGIQTKTSNRRKQPQHKESAGIWQRTLSTCERVAEREREGRYLGDNSKTPKIQRKNNLHLPKKFWIFRNSKIP